MRLSDYKNEDALDLLCDIIEPTAKILADKEMAKAVKNKTTKINAIKIAIRNHKDSVIEILARLDGIEVSEANYTIISITTKLLDILNDKELTDFFTSQAQTAVKTSSLPVTEITEAKGK